MGPGARSVGPRPHPPASRSPPEGTEYRGASIVFQAGPRAALRPLPPPTGVIAFSPVDKPRNRPFVARSRRGAATTTNTLPALLNGYTVAAILTLWKRKQSCWRVRPLGEEILSSPVRM